MAAPNRSARITQLQARVARLKQELEEAETTRIPPLIEFSVSWCLGGEAT